MNIKIVIGGFVILLVTVGAILLLSKPPSPSNVSKDVAKIDAIAAVIARYPELAAYKTTSLPPSSIEAEMAPEGWYVGFIQTGSGVPGVLHAECYRVSTNKEVTSVGKFTGQSDKTARSIILKTCTPVYEQGISPTPTPGSTPVPTTPPTSTGKVLPYGNVTLKLNQLATFKNISLLPLSIVEDSRCPSDVQCIQAGTVRVKVRVISGMGTSTSILTLGKVFTTEAEMLTLTRVTPDTQSTKPILNGDYRLTFNVALQSSLVPNNPKGKCYVGGCSAQVCSDQPGAISTCEYRPEYACYQTATCERQQTGVCGWTENVSLTACLAKP